MFLTVLVTLYLFCIAYLGYRGWRGTRTAADYMVAGRQIHPFIMALSYGATFISTSAIVGFGGVAAHFGGMGLLWLTFLNIFVGIFIAFVFLGGRTRRMGHRLNAHTFPELIGKRYKSSFLQIFTGLVIFLFMPLYTGVVLMGAAKMIDVRLGAVDYDTALLFFSLIVAIYVFMGGLKGVMYTDAMQGGIMFFGMVLVLILTYSHLGGVTEAHEKLTTLGKTALTETALNEQAANLSSNIPEASREAVYAQFGGEETYIQNAGKAVGGMLQFKKMGMKGWTSMPDFDTPLWWILVSTIILGVGIGQCICGVRPQYTIRS